jgi:hypothetical protein
VVALVIKSVKNPRSALCKTALMTSTDMFKAYQDQLLDLLDPLVWTSVLLLRIFCWMCTTKWLILLTRILYIMLQ